MCLLQRTMSRIILRSSSGKWKYETITDDKLFQPILGSMIEEGMKLEDELVIGGALGEALDEQWKYVEMLREWIDWESRCLDVSNKEILQHQEELGGHPDYGRVTNNRVRRIEYGNIEESRSVLYVKEIRPPQEVLWRHKFAVLINALTLPEGWELHVVVDEHTPLIERQHHLQSSLNYLRKNAASALRRGCDRFTSGADDFRIHDGNRIMGDIEVVDGSLLESLARNCLLIELSNLIENNEEEQDMPYLTNNIMIDRLDWEVAREMTKDNAYNQGNNIYSAAEFLLGKSYVLSNLFIKLEQREDGLSLASIGYIKPEECDRLMRLYKKILDILPEDSMLGIEPILGIVDEDMHGWYAIERPHTVVNWTNYMALTYLQWCRTCNLHARRTTDKRGWEALPITRTDFPEIVNFLGKTLGLYALRRILLSLLYYILKNANKARNPRKGKVSQKTQEKREKLLQAVERAELFADLVEKYLEQHEGEDTSIITMKLGETEEAKNARKYYL
jgi:hypothetical protein